MSKYKDIYWADEDTYKKARWHLRVVLDDVLTVFEMYGLGAYIPGAVEEILQAADDYALVLRGVNKQIRVTDRKNARAER